MTYEVGYRKPPARTKFTKGKSGNPKGRPNGARNLKTDLLDELHATVVITESGRRRTLTRQRVLLKRLMNDALQGNQKASATLLNLIMQFERSDSLTPEQMPSSNEDALIVQRFLEKMRRTAKDRKP